MIFFLGTHHVNHIGQTEVPLFVSRRRLAEYRTFPRARGAWALDSGGFTELSKYGSWSITPEQYVREVRVWRREIGGLLWCAPMDYMCEPNIVAKTGLSVEIHQRRTVQNYLRLREELGDLVIPVVQGWEHDGYLKCVDLFDQAGVDLTDYPTVGVGSVCRRGSTDDIVRILTTLRDLGIRSHGFGVKGASLKRVHSYIASADSLAWSYAARYTPPLPGHDLPGPGRRKGHRNCANCLPFALAWRERLLSKTLEDQRVT